MKKLFGEINLTWPKLIIFAVLAGVYTATMMLIPVTENTSFRDIGALFEWWILFGIIIICNSKSYKDSALKCFVFFLISQPLIYLIQVPFSGMGWGLFGYYRYWFMWTLACLPMGFIGYYIKKKNWLSALILLPMIIFLAYLGLGYLNMCMESFPYHLLSFLSCIAMIIVIVLGVLDDWKQRIAVWIITIVFIIAVIFLQGGFVNDEFEVYKSLDEYNFSNSIDIYSSTGTEKGGVELIPHDDTYNVKLNGRKKGQYSFSIEDGNKLYSFEYHYEDDKKTIVLNYLGEEVLEEESIDSDSNSSQE